MRDLESWIVNWPRIRTPLGILTDSGLLVNSKGTGLETFRVHRSFAVVLLLEGGGVYRDESGFEETLRAGDCLWVVPGVAHHYGPGPGDRWTEIYLNFEGPAFDLWRSSPFLGERPVRRLQNPALWFPRWKMIAESRPKDVHQVVSVLAQIHLLLSELAEVDSQARTFEDRLEQSKLHLEAWPPGVVPDWAQLAAECGCGYEKWRKAFRDRFHISPGKFRIRALMERAARLMARCSLSNAELAEQFGCADEFHFSRLFKQIHGSSPRTYRSQLAKGTEGSR